MARNLASHLLIAPVACCLLVPAGCSPHGEPAAPIRTHDTVTMPTETSSLVVPIDTDLGTLAGKLDAVLPRTLWTIDRHLDRCVPPQRIKLLGTHMKITPAIACSLAGIVTRGPLRLHGASKELIADIPVDAHVTARDVGGVLKGETATGSALVEARIRLDIAPDWSPRGSVRLHYDWTEPPGIDILGQRITFTDKADEKLLPVVQKLQESLPRELAAIDLRAKAANVWRSAFTSISLNADRPPVWMRITPKSVMIGGYEAQSDHLHVTAGLTASTETFVGPRPADPKQAPLPNLSSETAQHGLRLFIPVSADYGELEPVVMRALVKRSRRPFDLPGLGPVIAKFDAITAYGTTGGRIAVGIDLAAAPLPDSAAATHGRVWLVARPSNQPGSARISFGDLSVTGRTNGKAGDLLIALVNSPGVSGAVASALEQNLDRDLGDLVTKIRRAVAERREGDFVIRAKIERVQTGVVRAAGDGVHLPVRVLGNVAISYMPTQASH